MLSLVVVVLLVAGIALIGAIFAVGAGGRALREMVAEEVEQLKHGSAAVPSRTWDESRWAALPEPVRRYLRFAIPTGQPAIRWARLTQHGEMRLRPDREWLPLTAEEYITGEPPGFVWQALVQLKPWMWWAGRDKYLAGQGARLIKLATVVPVVDRLGREMDQSGLVRVLTELVWLPTALRLGGPVRWEAEDEDTARAVITDRGREVAARFYFGPRGEVRRVTTRDNFREEGGKVALTEWTATLDRYEAVQGVMVPREAEAAWVQEGVEMPYVRLRVTEIHYSL